MPVTFDYDTWDPTKESIPRREVRPNSPGGGGPTEPFTVENLLFAMFAEYTPRIGDPIRTRIIKTLQANLSITISRFRQLGMPAADLQRLIKAYPQRGLTPDAAVLHEVRESRTGFANVSNRTIQLPEKSKWEVRQDNTGKKWSLHPRT